jgi:hypothetical protein
MRRMPLLLTLMACRDRTPPAPPCEGVNEAVLSVCRMPTPIDCETANDDFIRCVDKVASEATSCAPMRQAITRCVVKHTD